MAGRTQPNSPGQRRLPGPAAPCSLTPAAPTRCAAPVCCRSRVEAACREIGGQLVEAGQEARSSSLGSHRFSFSFLQRNWNSAWGEAAGPLGGRRRRCRARGAGAARGSLGSAEAAGVPAQCRHLRAVRRNPPFGAALCPGLHLSTHVAAAWSLPRAVQAGPQASPVAAAPEAAPRATPAPSPRHTNTSRALRLSAHPFIHTCPFYRCRPTDAGACRGVKPGRCARPADVPSQQGRRRLGRLACWPAAPAAATPGPSLPTSSP